MKSRTGKIIVVILAVIFFADDINVDGILAPLFTKVFHRTFLAINRDLVENGANHQKISTSTRTCASTSIIPVDDDDFITLDTAFPTITAAANAPEITAAVRATHCGFISVTYLSLHTLLI